jgi:hypothetical protein
MASTLPGPAPRGASWGARGVWQLVTRRTYLGEWAFGGAVVRVPAIVDAATWHAAQAALEVSGRRGLRRTRHVYLCDDGVGVCGYCGGALRVRWGGRRSQVSYYFCADKICTGGWRRTEVVDREVWERVVAALLREDLVGRAAAEESEAGADAAAAERQAGSFAAQLEKLAAHERSVLALHRRELVSEAAMGWEMEEIRRRRRMLEKSAADAEREASQARAGMAALVEVQRAARALAGELAQLEGAERREAVRGLRTAVREARPQDPRPGGGTPRAEYASRARTARPDRARAGAPRNGRPATSPKVDPNRSERQLDRQKARSPISSAIAKTASKSSGPAGLV